MRAILASVAVLALLASYAFAHDDKCGTQQAPLTGGLFGGNGKRAVNPTCRTSLTSTCAATCDDPEWREAYSQAVDNNQLDQIIIHTKVNTFAPPQGVSGEPHTNEARNTEQLATLSRYYASLKVNFTAELNAVSSNMWWTKLSFDMDACSANVSQVGDGVAAPVCAFVGLDGGDLICPDQTTCGTCTIRSACLTSPWTCGRDFLNVPDTCNCACVKDSSDNDAGSQASCPDANLGNGVCNPECNFKRIGSRNLNWDGGDCCTPANVAAGAQCWDPSSPQRSWTGPTEVKAFFNQVPSTFVNHYIVNFFVDNTVLGVATFPWDTKAQTVQGGVVNRADTAWGTPNAEYTGVTAVHELGHVLGLWHTHTGVTEIAGDTKELKCAAPCFEQQPLSDTAPSSNVTGDLCGDTRPTPINFECQDPSPCNQTNESRSFCSAGLGTDCSTPTPRLWTNTPFRNPMGYANDGCMDNGGAFSRDQRGRMRCYIDCAYSNWKQTELRNNAIPPTIVRAPVAVNAGAGPSISWFAPLGPAENSAYTLERQPAFTSAVTVPSGTLQYQDLTAASGASVRYRVKKGTANFWSPWSDAITVSNAPVAAPPTSAAPTAGSTAPTAGSTAPVKPNAPVKPSVPVASASSLAAGFVVVLSLVAMLL